MSKLTEPVIPIAGQALLERDTLYDDFNPFGHGKPASDGEAPPGELEESPEPPEEEPEGEPAKPETETGTEPTVEIAGVGAVKVSDIRGLMLQKAEFDEFQKEAQGMEEAYEELQAREQKVTRLENLSELMDYPEVARAVAKAVSDVLEKADSVDLTRNGKGADTVDRLAQRLPHRTDQAQEDPRLGEMEIKVHQSEIRDMFRDLKDGNPEIWSPELQREVLDTASIMYRDTPEGLSLPALRLLAENILLRKQAQGLKPIEQALKKEPRGTRLVTGSGRRSVTQPTLPDPRKVPMGKLMEELDPYTQEE